MPDARPTHGQWTKVSIKDIIIPSNRVRRDFSHIKELIESIRRVGLLHPLVVTKQPDGKYALNAGESRYRAVLLLGWTEVPVTFWSDLSAFAQKEIELEENLRRSDLVWSEEVEGLRQLDEIKRQVYGSAMQGGDGKGWTQEKTAEIVGQSPKTVREKIHFATLLKARPELMARVKDLPMKVAMRQVEQIEEGERVARLHASGELKLSTELRLGDARELIKQLAPGSVDLILTDPPFGIATLDETEGKYRGTVQSYKSVLKPADNATGAEVHGLIMMLAPEFTRVLKPGGHLYMFFGMDLYAELRHALGLGGLITNPVPLIWDKGLITAPFRGYDYSPCYEPILFAYKPPRTRRLAAPGKTIISGFSPDRAEDKIHPFQKPQALLKYLIEQSTTLGQRVLDPFAGSGATIIAARNTARTGLGFELDKEHFEQAQSRLLKGDFDAEV